AVEIPVALDQLGRAINNQRRAVDILKEAWFESLSIQSVLELFRISFHRWAHNAETITPRGVYSVVHRRVEVLGVIVQIRRVFGAKRVPVAYVVMQILRA
ncbi:hypothetical protein, partial [Pseudomonas aeruginosa]|uniref:hypothetical protein n=2 Tax=Pseudomonas aeruginosa TaxID=287 RepID=UPI00141B8B5F